MADAAKTVRITLVKSPIGYHKSQKDTVTALGLKKMQSSREILVTPQVAGMLHKVQHLLKIEDVDSAAAGDA